MFPNLKIDLVAPPFAGHLYPALCLARGLKEKGFTEIRVLTTRSGLAAVEQSGLSGIEILGDGDALVQQIANTQSRVGSNPFRLWGQLKSNLSLMGSLQRELVSLWSTNRPELVIADFTVPVAGITAQSLGIAWWTGMPTPCALETRNGVPSYLGGYSPSSSIWSRLRNYIGRKGIRCFKGAIATLIGRDLAKLGIPRIYRADGTEAIYSSEKILGYGVREFEFNTDWPEYFEFIGPLVDPPLVQRTKNDRSSGDTAHSDSQTGEPQNRDRIREDAHSAQENGVAIGNSVATRSRVARGGRPMVLVTLGTHLGWAKKGALQRICELANLRPEYDFHFSTGYAPVESVIEGQLQGNNPLQHCRHNNVTVYRSVPYERSMMERYSAAIVHGGTGITYACLRSGIPMVVWPHDYDQFDHAARIEHAGVGVLTRGYTQEMMGLVDRVLRDPGIRQRCDYFSELVGNYHPIDCVVHALQKRFGGIVTDVGNDTFAN